MLRSALVLGISLLMACSSDSTDSTSSSSSSSSGGASSSSGSTACAPALGAAPAGCPASEDAESAFNKVQSTCAILDGDLDVTNADSPTLKADAKAKACASCDCRKAIYAYETAYQACKDTSEAANTALAKNLFDLASACK
ncbi:MAG: hypothetical protein U0270_30095 [Labilithrix sp.]